MRTIEYNIEEVRKNINDDKAKIEEIKKNISILEKQMEEITDRIEKNKKIEELKKQWYSICYINLKMFEEYIYENGKYYSVYRIVPSFFKEVIVRYESVKDYEVDRPCDANTDSWEPEKTYSVEVTKEIPIYKYEWCSNYDLEYISEKRELVPSYFNDSTKELILKEVKYWNRFYTCELSEIIKEMKKAGYDFKNNVRKNISTDEYVNSDGIECVCDYLCHIQRKYYDIDPNKYVLTSNENVQEEKNKSIVLKK